VLKGFKACLADLFFMREPAAGGHIAAVPGTEVYRAANTHEAAISAISIDQLGLHKEAEAGYRLPLDLQEPDGNWDDNRGWGHSMWSCSGFKTWFVMTHYRLTGDRKYLAKVYPRMLAASRWREKQRARSRVMEGGVRPLTYGLMPRGFGDCGLYNDDDMYGVFTPHNIWAVYADKMAVEAARILGKDDEAAELGRIYENGCADLLDAMDRGAIAEGGYRWIPGSARERVCGAPERAERMQLLRPTIRLIEGRISTGVALSPEPPIHTVWLAEECGPITSHNLAEGPPAGGKARRGGALLRARLNHGTPLTRGCEDKRARSATSQSTGTPAPLDTDHESSDAPHMLVTEHPTACTSRGPTR